MGELRDAERGNIIHLPNRIPQFLLNSVIDMTPMVLDAIDKMSLDPHVAEHMKHSVGHYYEDKDNKWSEQTAAALQSKLDAMEKEYRLLDTVKEGADLTGVKYIVIPDVGATDDAIKSRTTQLDTLFKANPNLTLVVAFADGVTAVGDNFCYDSSTIQSTLSPHVKKISFTGKNIKTVGDGFFANARSLTTVDFKGLSALQTVGENFFAAAWSLTSVDFRGLSALETVGHHFFSEATSLISVNFRELSALETVGRGFFADARSLISVDFRGLSALKTVGRGFFAGARLTSVDFIGLSALETVGDHFFSYARFLTSVDFRELSALKTVGDNFFFHAEEVHPMIRTITSLK